MEALAFLHLAQDYENPELKELCIASNGLSLLIKRSPTKLLSSTGAIALLSLLSTAWVAGLTQAASATVYGAGVYGVDDYGTDVYGRSYRDIRPGVPGYQAVMVRPDGDQPYAEQTCGCAANLCGGYQPVRPQPLPNPDYRPIRPQPVRPAGVFLRRGDTGSDVRYVQDLLRSAGYFNASSTGFYATLTESGVKSFQRDQGLSVDGIVGAQTLAALENRA
ncbi:MAG: peptidoglycan-binding protein [Drouetiella hepatica Uher 2000/2452]|jgi:hypothetical protein|uniref:Peptidoglycan-binding protein n=1 Tax=Drouetiella hepatica Uher 2000/2452 TaxID=904376 RepID=A0A951QBD8_9CYAN|nr:peptidoglycan-binding protein [Drouetiella hepatica Uher 2000/2452]